MKKEFQDLWDDAKYIWRVFCEAIKDIPEFLMEDPKWIFPISISLVAILISLTNIAFICFLRK